MVGRPRSTRKLKQWMIEQVDKGLCPGLVWEDRKLGMFRIPWKHAGKQDYRHDEDAAIFKAWAKFKGKYKEGDKVDPATWKTRMRCALNKSSEFEEVPERSQLDISEPYKVYRIIEEGAQKRKAVPLPSLDSVKLKREEAPREESLSSVSTSPALPEINCKLEETDSGCDPSSGSEMSAQEESCRESGSLGSSMNPSPEADSTNFLTCDPAPVSPNIVETEPNAMFVSFRYGGVEVSSAVTRHGCKISSTAQPPAASFGSQSLEKLCFPPASCIGDPVKRQATAELLNFLERGVMLDSNAHGIFAQRLCQGRVFWTGPGPACTNQPRKLERARVEKLFDRRVFEEELEQYRQGKGVLPQHQVTLCFGEEFSEKESIDSKLITVQVHQIATKQLLDQELEIQNTSFLLLEPLTEASFGEALCQDLAVSLPAHRPQPGHCTLWLDQMSSQA
ncbi:interferon regulatory factor 8-like isoform X2 [Hypanus sabinus]|uniref:interferon regulatory factor 8-like isoform X2 n=1 Tax=Hypanus sabinus TaxID=79690 RepID=UPI0028C46DB4|nr:interferon regulatory factor 8-like isoform X2 [Hypanus sabinus]